MNTTINQFAFLPLTPIQARYNSKTNKDILHNDLVKELDQFQVCMYDDSMEEAHIPKGAVLEINNQVQPFNRCIVLAFIEEKWVIRRFIKNSSGIRLLAANEKYPPITSEDRFIISGTVTKIIIDALDIK